MNRIGTASTPVSLTGHRHLAALREALTGFEAQADKAVAWGVDLAARMSVGSRLLAAGNGGSAAQAQHLTAELVGRYCSERPPYSAICLTSETSTLTAIANDYPLRELFARQVEAHGRPGDVLVLMSTSGRSLNIVSAAQRAARMGIAVRALTGPLPNQLARYADDCIAVDAPIAATVQELHLVLLHLMCEAFDASIESAVETGGAA